MESMSNEITNIGLSVVFTANICALLFVLMVRHRTVRKAPAGCPWPVAVLYRKRVASDSQLRTRKAEPASCDSFVSPYGGNQEGADPNGTGSADSHAKVAVGGLRLNQR